MPSPFPLFALATLAVACATTPDPGPIVGNAAAAAAGPSCHQLRVARNRTATILAGLDVSDGQLPAVAATRVDALLFPFPRLADELHVSDTLRLARAQISTLALQQSRGGCRINPTAFDQRLIAEAGRRLHTLNREWLAGTLARTDYFARREAILRQAEPPAGPMSTATAPGPLERLGAELACDGPDAPRLISSSATHRFYQLTCLDPVREEPVVVLCDAIDCRQVGATEFIDSDQAAASTPDPGHP